MFFDPIIITALIFENNYIDCVIIRYYFEILSMPLDGGRKYYVHDKQ